MANLDPPLGGGWKKPLFGPCPGTLPANSGRTVRPRLPGTTCTCFRTPTHAQRTTFEENFARPRLRPTDPRLKGKIYIFKFFDTTQARERKKEEFSLVCAPMCACDGDPTAAERALALSLAICFCQFFDSGCFSISPQRRCGCLRFILVLSFVEGEGKQLDEK